MPRWTPEPVWEGQDVFVIGGGDSLRTFDFERLRNEKTVGCNNAYLRGPEICNVCIFGDEKWFKHHLQKPGKALERYARTAILVTNASQLQGAREPWLKIMGRQSKGLHTDSLGWNTNTGASALNLALLLGGQRIFLLGFDMQLSKDGKPNYHDDLIDRPDPAVYARMIEAFGKVKRDWVAKFHTREIINVTNDSKLPFFPKVNADEFWRQRTS
jgi:hypothetical protein